MGPASDDRTKIHQIFRIPTKSDLSLYNLLYTMYFKKWINKGLLYIIQSILGISLGHKMFVTFYVTYGYYTIYYIVPYSII